MASIKFSGSLTLGCPDPSCVVSEDMVQVSDEDRKKYSRYLYCSYDEDKKGTKQCPRPGCELAVEFLPGSTSYDVVCRCGHRFCWNCVEDAHRPVDCDTVQKWYKKTGAESESVIWMLANSKPCPKCRRPILKTDRPKTDQGGVTATEGALNMTCLCGVKFCWLCLGDWSTHGQHTGGYYRCNVYAEAKTGGLYDEEENIRKKAKEYLDGFALSYKRFAELETSRLKAVERLKKMQSEDFADLSHTYGMPDTQLEFITDAWLQIIECRRVLKWTFVYGYYIPTSEYTKTQFFRYLVGEAESALEKLHQCAEVELGITYLNEFYYRVLKEDDFNSYRFKLVGITSVTRKYFENLVGSLEQGLSEVGS